MLRAGLATGILTLALAVLAQTASADPMHAKNALVVTATCPSGQVQVVVNGNGEFTPAHVLGSTSVFIPTAFDLTFTSPQGTETDTAMKHSQRGNLTTCDIPQDLNTFPAPGGGTFSLSGTVTGFFTPGR